jgi:hypothetical protein
MRSAFLLENQTCILFETTSTLVKVFYHDKHWGQPLNSVQSSTYREVKRTIIFLFENIFWPHALWKKNPPNYFLLNKKPILSLF